MYGLCRFHLFHREVRVSLVRGQIHGHGDFRVPSFIEFGGFCRASVSVLIVCCVAALMCVELFSAGSTGYLDLLI